MDNTQHTRIRILLHPQLEERLLDQVVGVLEGACGRHPEHFDLVKDQPGTIDHYGYSDATLGAVILSKQDSGPMYLLTIHAGRHPIFDLLTAIVAEHMGLPAPTPPVDRAAEQAHVRHILHAHIAGQYGCACGQGPLRSRYSSAEHADHLATMLAPYRG